MASSQETEGEHLRFRSDRRLATSRLRRCARRRLSIESLETRRLLAYYESFENGLGPEWEIISVDPQARVQIRDLAAEAIITAGPSLEISQGGNNQSLVFDSSNLDNNNDLGIAIARIGALARSDAILTFHQYNIKRGNDESLPGEHSTNAMGNGIAISDDGNDWYTLFDRDGAGINRSGDGLWTLRQIDLGRELDRINTDYPTAK